MFRCCMPHRHTLEKIQPEVKLSLLSVPGSSNNTWTLVSPSVFILCVLEG